MIGRRIFIVSIAIIFLAIIGYFLYDSFDTTSNSKEIWIYNVQGEGLDSIELKKHILEEIDGNEQEIVIHYLDPYQREWNSFNPILGARGIRSRNSMVDSLTLFVNSVLYRHIDSVAQGIYKADVSDRILLNSLENREILVIGAYDDCLSSAYSVGELSEPIKSSNARVTWKVKSNPERLEQLFKDLLSTSTEFTDLEVPYEGQDCGDSYITHILPISRYDENLEKELKLLLERWEGEEHHFISICSDSICKYPGMEELLSEKEVIADWGFQRKTLSQYFTSIKNTDQLTRIVIIGEPYPDKERILDVSDLEANPNLELYILLKDKEYMGKSVAGVLKTGLGVVTNKIEVITL